MEDCIFCKIIKGDIPGKVVYEDEYTMCFMDVAGDVDGHMLVVPKKHVKNILECDKETLDHVMDTVQKVSKHLVEDCEYEGINVYNNNNECANQSVPHMHFHIVPRKTGDDVNAWPEFGGAKKDISEIFENVKMK